MRYGVQPILILSRTLALHSHYTARELMVVLPVLPVLLLLLGLLLLDRLPRCALRKAQTQGPVLYSAVVVCLHSVCMEAFRSVLGCFERILMMFESVLEHLRGAERSQRALQQRLRFVCAIQGNGDC